MNQKSEMLNQQDVIKIQEEKPASVNIMTHITFLVDEFFGEICSRLSTRAGTKLPPNKWFKDGVAVEVLSEGKPWRKGKIRLAIEFIADEPESPLDDFRESNS